MKKTIIKNNKKLCQLSAGSIFRLILAIVLIVGFVAGYFVVFDKDRALIARADYLRLTEDSNFFYVQSNIYGIRLNKNDGGDYAWLTYYDGNGLNIGDYGFGPLFRVDGVYYRIKNDTNRITSLVENNKERVVIRVAGTFDSTTYSGENFLTDGTNEIKGVIELYFYKDYFLYSYSVEAYNGVNIDNSESDIFSVGLNSGFYDSGERYAGTTTGEQTAGNYSDYFDVDYVSVLATSTPDWQILKIYEIYNGTTTAGFEAFTENPTQQVASYFYKSGNIKGSNKVVLAVRPKIGTTEASRLAWAQQMLAMDSAEFVVGAESADWGDMVYQGNRGDGTYNVSAENNKTEFTVHANATNTWATLSATSTGGASVLAIANDQGLEDPGGSPPVYGESQNSASSSWAYVGNRLPYGSFDVNDPDVLFYWDMNSTTTGQAPNKGVGPIVISGNFENNIGVSGNSLRVNGNSSNVKLDKNNIPQEKGALSFWYRFSTTTDPGLDFDIFRHGDSYNDGDIFGLWQDAGNNQLVFRIGNSGCGFVGGDIVLFDGGMNHYRIIWDDENDLRRMYFNGSLIGECTDVFTTAAFTNDFEFFSVDGYNYDIEFDEFYISSDPDQPDGPSYFDTIKYYDVSGGQLTGIPETGLGSLKWNHPINSPVWQTQREDPVFAVRDWSPKTRSTSTGEYVDHLVLDLPLDGAGKNADAGKVWDKVSGSWVGSIVGPGISWEQGRQGNAVRFNSPIWQSVTYVTAPSTGFDSKKGTIEFDYRYVSGIMSRYYDAMFGVGLSQGEFTYSYTGSEWCFFYNQISMNCIDDSLVDDGEWHHFRLTWDQPNGYYTLLFDNELSATSTTISEAVFNTDLYVGNRSSVGGYRPMHGQLDNFRVYDDIILPYGAYYTGKPNDGHYGGAHPDVIDYWNGSDSATQIATKTIIASNCTLGAATSTDGTVNSATRITNTSGYVQFDANIGTEGSLSFWFKPEYSFGDSLNHNLVGGYVDATDRLEITKRAGNALYFYLGTDSIYVDTVDWATSTWHHIRAAWNRVDGSNDYMELWLDGESVAVSNTEAILADFDLTFFRIGNTGNYSDPDAVFDELYLTDSADTPQIPTAFGKPLIAPIVAITDESTDQKRISTDYDISMLSDITSWLVTYQATLQDDTTFLITESLNPPAAADPAVPLNRVHPLISTSYTTGYATITVQRGDGSYADDFKLIFSEADAGVSSCYIGAGTAGEWGDNLCSATSLLSEIDQNSVLQTDQTGVLSLIQSSGVEAIVRNYFTLPGEATSTEDWHIFADGSIVVDRKYEKTDNSEQTTVNANFTNYVFYPSAPATDRAAGVYKDSYFLNLTSVNTDRQNDYLGPQRGATSSISGLHADLNADLDADGYAEGYGAYVLDSSYAADPSIPVCSGTCGQPIYHTIGTSSATVSVTAATVDAIQTGIFAVTFSGSPDLSGIHKRDKFTDSGGDDWNIILIDDANDQIMVGDQEVNGDAPATGAGSVGPWYNSLFAWEAAEDRDLTSTTRYPNGEIEMAECWPLIEYPSATINIGDWISSENNFVKIYTPISARHSGVMSDDSYLINVDTLDVYGIRIGTNFVRIDGLQIDMSGGDKAAIEMQNQFDGYGTEIIISNNILRGANTSYDSGVFIGDANISDVYVFNNIIYDANYGDGGSGDGSGIYLNNVLSSGLNALIYDNTIFDCSNGITADFDAGNVIFKNNIIQGCDDGIYKVGEADFSPLSGYNISNTDDAPGSNNRSCTVSFVSTSTADFHLASDDTCAKGAGSPLYQEGVGGVFSDIDSQTRPSKNWDIGADQTIGNHANKFKIEFNASDQTIYAPRFMINDFYPQSGKRGSEEEYVIAHLPLDGLVNTEYVYDKVSGSSTLFRVYNYASTGFQSAYRSNGIMLDRGVDKAVHFNVDSVGMDKYRGSVNFWYTPQTDSENGQPAYLFRCQSSDGFSVIRYSDDGIYFYAGDTDFDYFSMNYQRGVPINIGASWYRLGENYYRYLMVNGQVVGNLINTDTQADFTDNCAIGAYDQLGSFEAQGTIDEFKIYSEPILPFGAFYTGFEQNNNYENADPSLVFYWDAESEMANYPSSKIGSVNSAAVFSEGKKIIGAKGIFIPSGSDRYTFTVEDGNILDKAKGLFGFWFYPTSSTLNDIARFYIDENNLMYVSTFDSSGNLVLRVGWKANGASTDYVQSSAGDLALNAWNWVKITWDSINDQGNIFINGRQSGSTVALDEDMVGEVDVVCFGDCTSNWGSPYYLDQIFITNDPASQEIPTAFGKPLNVPLMKVDNVRQRYGYDYAASFSPDPSSVVLQYFKDVTDLSVFEVGGGEGEAQVKTLKGGVRLNGGIRF